MVRLATMAPNSTCFLYCQAFELHSIREKMKRSADGQPQTPPNIFNKVFSSHLDPSKTWYALNSQICCGKPSTFCSSGIAKVFVEDYKVVQFSDLRDQHGVVPPFKWFNSLNRKSEMVCVATTFGIYVGLMRSKKPEECPLIFGEAFKSIRELINNKGFDSKIHSDLTELCDERFSRLESHSKVLEAQLNSAAQELVFLRAKIRKDAIICTTGTESPPKSIPPKSSPPKLSMDSTPPKERPNSIADIKANEELSPVTKKRKVKEKFKVIMNELGIVLESNGETLGSIVTECCLSARERSRDDHGVVDAVGMAFKEITRNHGAVKAFEMLVPEEAWAKRVEAMQVPDWVSLLAKLKTRLSDSSWQDFTSLTKLGRTGKNGDGDILILKGSLKALRKGIFDVTNSLMGIAKLQDCEDIHGYESNLESAVVWTAREMRLHGHIPEEIIFNLKVDGRPFFGMYQDINIESHPHCKSYQRVCQ